MGNFPKNEYPKGYTGPGYSPDVEMKKKMLKKLKNRMDTSSAQKLNAARQKQENVDSVGVSSVNPTYPGFKGTN